MRRNQDLDLFGNLRPMLAQGRELGGQPWQDDAGGVRSGDDDGLRSQGREDVLGEPPAEPRCSVE